MVTLRYRKRLDRIVVACCGALMVLLPSALWGQTLAHEALSSFPMETQQLAYTNLATLRANSDYQQIRQLLLNQQLRNFQDFLSLAGIDVEKDVDEVMLGWNELPSGMNFFGLASGRFQPDHAQQFFGRSQFPTSEYQGMKLYGFNSGGNSSSNMFFVFLNSSLAAFGRLNDLKSLLDVRSGARPSFESNTNLMKWESQLEGAAPQWGIVTGAGAANAAAVWFTSGKQSSIDPTVLLKPVQTVLYRLDWDSGFSLNLTVICQDAQSAAFLGKMLTLLRDSQSNSSAGTLLPIAPLLQDVNIDVDGNQLDLTASGPIQALNPILRGPAPAGSQ